MRTGEVRGGGGRAALWMIPVGLAPAACIPYPHDQQEAPALSGVLVVEGKPAVGVKVRLSVNAPATEAGCPAGSKETLTDELGVFRFPRTTYRSAVIAFGDRWDSWRLCFERAGGATWEGRGMWGGPPGQQIHCDLGKPRPDGAEVVRLSTIAEPLPDEGCWVREVRGKAGAR